MLFALEPPPAVLPVCPAVESAIAIKLAAPPLAERLSPAAD
jgi:hypothetical protein